MTDFRISYSPDLKHWRIQPTQGGDKIIAARVVLDAPAKANGPFLEAKGCELKTNNVTQLGDRTVIETAFLRRHDQISGQPPKHDSQLEWCALFDPNTKKWYVFRQDDQQIVISTSNLEMDCHAITSNGIWHSHAELLVNGATNRDQAFTDAKSVRLRTLLVHDQDVAVDMIGMKPKVRIPGAVHIETP